MQLEVRIAGTGGQGAVLAGIILAEACGIYERKKVTQTQSYGPESRGGASKSDVIISDEEIFYPKARRLDILACLSQQSCDSYVPELKPNGVLIIDSFYVRYCSRENAYCLPLASTAREHLGSELFTNIILLGAIAGITGVVQIESLKAAVRSRVSAHTLDKNLNALELGFELGIEAQKKSQEATKK